MPVIHQPQSLLSFAKKRVNFEIIKEVSTVVDICKPNLNIPREELLSLCRDEYRPLWGGGALPATLRGQLLLECIAELDCLTPMGFTVCMAQDDLLSFLLAMLLDVDISEARLRLCCFGRCIHKEMMLRVLGHGVGAGLVTLELSRPSISFLDTELFQSILLSAFNLTSLFLRNIACDNVLKVIGNSCFKLKILDVSQSTRVTDEGISYLMHSQDESSSYLQRSSYNPMLLLNAEYLQHSNEPVLIRAIEEIDWPTVAVDRRRPLPCTATRLCETLRELNVAETNISRIGVVIALLSAGGLLSLGERCHVGRALELLSRCAAIVPLSDGLRLVEASSCGTTATKLRAIATMCPRLRQLTITGPMIAPDELDAAMPSTLARLNLKHVPMEYAWLDGLHAYLCGPRSRELRQLLLKFCHSDDRLNDEYSDDDEDNNDNGADEDNDECVDGRIDDDGDDYDIDGDDDDFDDDDDELHVTFDLGAFLFDMPELDKLVLDGILVTFDTPPPSGQKLDKLRRVNFGVVEGPDTLARLMQCAHSLEVLHVYACPGLDHLRFLDIFAGAARLNCVYINYLVDATEDTVETLTVHCPAIGHIGNVYDWGLSNEAIYDLASWMTDNNFNVRLHDSTHWFCCECFE